jgi:hypothetical protein
MAMILNGEVALTFPSRGILCPLAMPAAAKSMFTDLDATEPPDLVDPAEDRLPA